MKPQLTRKNFLSLLTAGSVFKPKQPPPTPIVHYVYLYSCSLNMVRNEEIDDFLLNKENMFLFMMLRAEPSNPHDAYAVEVFLKKNPRDTHGAYKIGYLPRPYNLAVNHLLRQNIPMNCISYERNSYHDDKTGCVIHNLEVEISIKLVGWNRPEPVGDGNIQSDFHMNPNSLFKRDWLIKLIRKWDRKTGEQLIEDNSVILVGKPSSPGIGKKYWPIIQKRSWAWGVIYNPKQSSQPQ